MKVLKFNCRELYAHGVKNWRWFKINKNCQSDMSGVNVGQPQVQNESTGKILFVWNVLLFPVGGYHILLLWIKINVQIRYNVQMNAHIECSHGSH